jgi:hypothetical protein
MARGEKRVREQAVVYLGQRDRSLLDTLAEQTGLSRTELFRRGLWALAAQIGAGQKSGSGFDHLIDTATSFVGPSDFSERADDYLYGGEYRTWMAREALNASPTNDAPPSTKARSPKRARPR